MPIGTYSSTPTSGQWWGSSIPRNAEGNIMVVQEIHHEYAACVYKKIREEWPYYRQLVAQNKCRHLYACSDASIDDCQHLQTPGSGACHCRRWKQLWDQQVFENYKFYYAWDRSEGEWVGAVKNFGDEVMDSLMHEDNGDQSPLVFDMPMNDLDFGDFHPYPLTFRDALSTHEVPRLSQVFNSDVETNLRDEDTDSEGGEIDSGNLSAEGADFEVLSTSSREASGSEVRGAVGNGTGSGFSASNGFGSHEFDDDQSEGVSSDDTVSDHVDSNGMDSEVSRPVDTNQRVIPSDAEHLDPPA